MDFNSNEKEEQTNLKSKYNSNINSNNTPKDTIENQNKILNSFHSDHLEIFENKSYELYFELFVFSFNEHMRLSYQQNKIFVNFSEIIQKLSERMKQKYDELISDYFVFGSFPTDTNRNNCLEVDFLLSVKDEKKNTKCI